MILTSLLLTFAADALVTSLPAADLNPAAPKVEKQICRRDPNSESRLGSKRICKSAAEWKRDRLGGDEGSGKTGAGTKSR